MAERAHPELPGFCDKWRFRLRRSIIPWISREQSPYRKEFDWRYQWVAKYCKGNDVLEIPCGMGWGTSLLKGCRTLVGVDIEPDAIAEARQRYGTKAKFFVGNMSKLEFDNSTFDVVVCLEGIEHVLPKVGKTFISEAARILRPGGMLFLSSPDCINKEHSGNPYHVKEYTPTELRALIDPYFDISDKIERKVDNLIINYFQAKLR